MMGHTSTNTLQKTNVQTLRASFATEPLGDIDQENDNYADLKFFNSGDYNILYA